MEFLIGQGSRSTRNVLIDAFSYSKDHPFVFEEPVGRDLRDDLQDIYADLRTGIREYQAGRESNALWECKFGVDNHWGQHAVDAIRTLHSIRVNK